MCIRDRSAAVLRREIEKMLRMYLLQCWFNLSDEGVEDAIYDSYADPRISIGVILQNLKGLFYLCRH